MNILILGFSKIKYMPYLRFYLEHMDRSAHRLHLVYWNRDGREERLAGLEGVALHEFAACQYDSMPTGRKLWNFLGYRRFVAKLIRRERFDRVVVLHSLPGILTYDLLKRRYRGRYLFDYRDITCERVLLYRRMIHGLVRDSWATFVSSNGFRNLLPRTPNIYTSHNIAPGDLSRGETGEPVPSEKIRVCFWGFIRDEKVNLQMIDRFSRDDRFELHYYGREQRVACELKAHAGKIGARNVFFHGEYAPEEKYGFVRSTDLIHNVFSGEKMLPAMSNKYYDGVVFGIPQLCMKGSVMAQRAEARGIGIGCDPWDENFTGVVYRYYTSLSRPELEQACRREAETVLKEYQAGGSIVARFAGR